MIIIIYTTYLIILWPAGDVGALGLILEGLKYYECIHHYVQFIGRGQMVKF